MDSRLRGNDIVLLLLAFPLTACTLGPDYTPTFPDIASWWHAAPEKTEEPAPQATTAWWESFGDGQLNALITQALTNSPTMELAQARVAEERALKTSARAGLFPQLSLGGDATRGNQQSAQSSALIPPGIPGISGRDAKPVTISQGAFDAQWEIDLFGATRRRVEAQNARIEAVEADLRAVQLTLIGDVAQSYIAWRALQRQEEILKRTAEAQATLASMAEKRFTAGTGSRFDSTQARALAESTAARLPELERQRHASAYRLSALTGLPPAEIHARLEPMAALPKPLAIPAMQEPAAVLRNRPDVQAAERQLAAATALQGAALADAFPKLTLSGLFGVLDTNLSDPTRIWSAGAGLAAPLLTFGRIEGNIRLSDARQAQAYARYRQTVFDALAEVETSLQNVAKTNQRSTHLNAAASNAAQSAKLARQRYENGVSAFADVLNAEQLDLNAQSEEVAAQAEMLNYLVQLHKALGLTPNSI